MNNTPRTSSTGTSSQTAPTSLSPAKSTASATPHSKQGRSTLPEYVQNIDTYNAQPSVGVTDPSPVASTETSRTATNSSPPRRPGRSRLPRDDYSSLRKKWYEAAPADIKTLSDGNRARFLATSAYQQWRPSPKPPAAPAHKSTHA